MEVVKVYSPAGWRVWRVSAWLESPIAAEWWCHWPWSTALTQEASSAGYSWQHKPLRQILSGSQMGYCIQTAPVHLGHSRQTPLQETEAEN